MERGRDGQYQRPSHAARLGDFDGAFDTGFRAGDDDLPRRVDVGDGEDLALRRFFTDDPGLVGGRADERGHGPRADRDGLLHELPALAHDDRGIGRGKPADTDDGPVLAEGVAGHEIAADCAEVFQHGVNGGGDGQDGGLRVLGQLELVLGTFEAELGDREAERIIDLPEDAPRDRVGLEDVLPHAGVLAPLAGKDECGVVFHCGANDSN